MAAPVLPAVTNPAARPSRTRRDPDVNGGIALGADGLDGFVVHGDDFTGVDDFDGKSGSGGMKGLKLGPQLFFVADKEDVNAVVPCGLSAHLRFQASAPGQTPSRPRL